ncbi:MAG: DUF4080 domain-containing protein [Gammaproteobacteria bacterium]|nr:DUF4080 domain-containing protein [Gammaproteobacteria bacterium]
MPVEILLSTLNARYMHTAFALRYLYANLGDLQTRAQLCEFPIQQRPIDIAEQLLSYKPKIIGFSVYIWNIEEITDVINLLKQVAPQIKIIVGGPEVSFAEDLPSLTKVVDYVITGPGETSFYKLCSQIIENKQPLDRIITGEPIALNSLTLPYAYYNKEDIRNRLIYVEASRGCPFKCEFCLSALDRTAKPFDLEKFLIEMDLLYQRGARNFKFIDRTFNLKVSSSVAILEFFLARMSDDLYLHFEVVPDLLPDLLKQVLAKFPQGSLQLEIGVQTFDSEIQALISRKQDNEKTRNNLRWLRENTGAHIHADLVFGLPGDSMENFAESFNQLVALEPQEIQLGILKRLRGAPINRHTQSGVMRYNPKAPYNILSTEKIDFDTMQRVNRFARFWGMIANSGRFKNTLPLLLGDNAFHQFLQLSDVLYLAAGSTWKISLKRLFELVYSISVKNQPDSEPVLLPLLLLDYQRSGLKGQPPFGQTKTSSRCGVANKRQRQHQ